MSNYLRAGLVDELHLAVVPILLGDGEGLFANLDGGPTGYGCVGFVAGSGSGRDQVWLRRIAFICLHVEM